LGQLAFAGFGKRCEQDFGNQQPEYGITKKFKPFIMRLPCAAVTQGLR
jgi:hypothetical protein